MDYSDLAPKPGKSWTAHRAPLGALDWIHFGFYERRDGLRTMVTIDLYDAIGDADAGHWLHLSISRARRLPTWPDLVAAAHELGYSDRCFVQLVPPKANWLNLSEYVLHLQSRLDGPSVPEALWKQAAATGEYYGKKGPLRRR